MKAHLLIFDFFHRVEKSLKRIKSVYTYRRGTKKRIKQYGSRLPELTSDEKKEIYDFWYKKHGFKPDYNMFRWYYGRYGIKDCRYVSEDIYDNYIWSVLNDRARCTGYNDKNMSDLLFAGARFPKTVVRCMNGEFLDGDYNLISRERAISLISGYDAVAVKPSIEGWEGKGVIKLEVKSRNAGARRDADEKAGVSGSSTELKGALDRADDLSAYISRELDKQGREFIVQEIVKQHSSLAALNESSVNVVRITSLLINGKVHILNSVIRIGSKGEFTDHFNIVIGIDANGRMRDTGISKDIEIIDRLPNGLKFGGMEIVAYEEMRQTAARLHAHTPQAGIIGWDMTADEKGEVVVIEGNLRFPGCMKVQDGTGPLFADLTDEVLEACRNAKSTGII